MAVTLPDEYTYLDQSSGGELPVWDDSRDTVSTVKIVCYGETLYPASALPITG